MKEFDYIIIGGGCAGLSLAYELEIYEKLKDKTLAIIEPREDYKRDKTWSFWKVFDHNFEDCVIKSWNNFTINTSDNTHQLNTQKFPYQSVDSGKFYEKINSKLSKNKNIFYLKSLKKVNSVNSIVFNSLIENKFDKSQLWQHFQGIEIETDKSIFDDNILNLMDFNCEQRKNVHFFYTLPFNKNRALIETTWLSDLKNNSLMDYDQQLKNYIQNNLGIKNYTVKFKEKGAIPLFHHSIKKEKNKVNIGSAGGMTRLSTGYTFLNIQEHSRYIRENIENIKNVNLYKIQSKYDFLDKILLKVLKNNSAEMGNIFFKVFNTKSKTAINFLSNKSNFFEDLEIILKMPKWKFFKEII